MPGFVRPQWAISHVLSGDVTTRCAGQTFRAPCGSVMVHPPGLPYSEWSDRAGVHEWLVVEASLDGHLDLLSRHPVSPVVLLRDPRAFSRLFDELLRRWHAPLSPPRDIGVAAGTLELLHLLLGEWQSMGAPPRPEALLRSADRFAELVAFMSEHLDQKLSRSLLARRLRLHPNSLDRAFAAGHGQTPLQMLRELRLERARFLLGSTELTLGAIAAQCGLEGDAHLSRAFKTRFGQTPGAFRASVKQATAGYKMP